MPPTDPSSSSSFEEAARRVEAEVKRWIQTMNDQVVPSIRKDGGKALRAAAEKLAKLAESLERERRPPQ